MSFDFGEMRSKIHSGNFTWEDLVEWSSEGTSDDHGPQVLAYLDAYIPTAVRKRLFEVRRMYHKIMTRDSSLDTVAGWERPEDTKGEQDALLLIAAASQSDRIQSTLLHARRWDNGIPLWLRQEWTFFGDRFRSEVEQRFRNYVIHGIGVEAFWDPADVRSYMVQKAFAMEALDTEWTKLNRYREPVYRERYTPPWLQRFVRTFKLLGGVRRADDVEYGFLSWKDGNLVCTLCGVEGWEQDVWLWGESISSPETPALDTNPANWYSI